MFDEAKAVLRQAKPGSIVPFVHTLPYALDALDYFSKLSDHGRKPGSVLFESAEVVSGYGELSIGFAEPLLRASFKAPNLSITALNAQGERFLSFVGEKPFAFAESLRFSPSEIKAVIQRPSFKGSESDEERLHAKSPLDALRALAFAFQPTLRPLKCTSGLFGLFSYDFIDYFEELPPLAQRPEPDFEFYFADTLFVIDHKQQRTHFVSNALVTDGNAQGAQAQEDRCLAQIEALAEKYTPARTLVPRYAPRKAEPPRPFAEQKFFDGARAIRENILAGNVFQAVLSAETTLPYNAVPLDAYRFLRQSNPSPYMFFFALERGQLLAASPEMCYRVEADPNGGTRLLEVRPIAGTRPRGKNPEEDSRLEAELLTDSKELAEHAMLLDLARNDVARVSVPGTRVVQRPFTVEKYSHVQHLVSTVRGRLRPGLDALHCYAACMNPGTLTGAPKPEAMKLLRELEGEGRGFYGGMACYLTPSGTLDSAIVIRALRLLDGKATVRAGAGFVLDSRPEAELAEVRSKQAACLEAIQRTGGALV